MKNTIYHAEKIRMPKAHDMQLANRARMILEGHQVKNTSIDAAARIRQVETVTGKKLLVIA